MKIAPLKTASYTICNPTRRRPWTRFLAVPFISTLIALSAYGATVTFDFESVTAGTTSFSSSGQTWTLTGDMRNVNGIDLGAPEVGTASPTSNYYMDTGYGISRGLGDVGGIKAPAGYVFIALSFDVWPSSDLGNDVYGGTDNTLGTVGLKYTVIGKKNGSQVVSANVTDTALSPAQSGSCQGGYWHHIDLSTTAFATTDIDTVEFVLVAQSGTAMNYLAVDNFTYSNFSLPPVATTTTVGSSPNPSTYGQSVTFTATVTRSGGTATPSGTVTFMEGATTLGTGALSGSGASPTATFSTSTLSVGNHTITANYPGDAIFSASSGSTASAQTVNRATPNVTAWPTASAITYGQTLASSSLTGGVATPTGAFAFTTPGTAPGAGTAAQGVTFTPSDTTDYTTVSGSVNVLVAPATAIITWPAATPIIVGQALSASSLSNGLATSLGGAVTGSFAFVNATVIPSAGQYLASVLFSPTSANFLAATNPVTVAVLDPQTGFNVTPDYVVAGYSINLSGVPEPCYAVSDVKVSWPASQTGWRLQAQTNCLDVGLSTNWTVIPGAESTNQMLFSTSNNPYALFRLAYP